MSERRGQDGFALVAAAVAALLFAYLAFAVVASNRGVIAAADAQYARARLEAGAESGLALALHGLGLEDPTRRWGLDGRPHAFAVDGVELTVTVEDERGKIPIEQLGDDATADRLIRALDLPQARGAALKAAFEDWYDEDEERRVDGAEALDYAPRGVRPRNGAARSIGELAELKGMDAVLLDRLRPAVTLFPGQNGFDPRNANPLATAAMIPGGAGSPQAIERARQLSGQRTAIETGPAEDYRGRPLTVRVLARGAGGAVLRRAVVVEFTGRRDRPYLVRALD